MNKTAIKNYAVWARVQLIEAVKQRAFEYEITESGEYNANLDSINGRVLSAEEKEQRSRLIELIKQKGYEQVMEEAAYTWFNRFIALRFMEVNGYLPSKTRVFTDENNQFKPEILKQAMTVELDGLGREKVLDLIENQKNQELYKYLLITQCNALNSALPEMFEKIGGWTELLFPSNLLKTDSVLERMIKEIPEDNWTDQVEIIGWLYQYYNTEPKDKVFARPSGQKIRKEDVPAATQLFTPDWIVRYMIENSLGRIAVNHELSAFSFESEQQRQEKEKEIAASHGWKYYLAEAEQTPEVRAQLNADSKDQNTDLTQICVLDPCMGSGHILVYAFEVLMEIYKSQGYSERDAAQEIVKNNLYGLELDDRAAQLAYFAVMMKARSYDRRFLTRGIYPHLCSIQESNSLNTDYLELFGELKPTAQKLVDEFIDAKEYGSILNLKISADEIAQLESKYNEINEAEYDNIFNTIRQIGLRTVFVPLLRQAKIMVKKYNVVCTNPPYMGGSGMSTKLSAFVKKNYPDSKADLFAVFMEKCTDYTKHKCFTAMITMHSWMFLSSFEKLRENLLLQTTVNMAHLGARAFDQIGGEVVQTTAFVHKKERIKDYLSTYKRLIELNSENAKREAFLTTEYDYTANADNFSKIPGSPIAYWVSEKTINLYNSQKIYDVSKPCKGIDTGDNNKYIRLWFEINNEMMFYPKMTPLNENDFQKKWYPYNKGGSFRRWFGNGEYLLNWESNGKSLKHFKGSNLRNKDYYFHQGLTWSTVTSAHFSIRRFYYGYLFDNGGCCLFSKYDLEYYCGLLNSSLVKFFLALSPTLNFQPGDIGKIPVIKPKKKIETIINNYVEENIGLSKSDWDSFETSWDFKKHPLAVSSLFVLGDGLENKYCIKLSDAFRAWAQECNERFNQLKANEEELNRIFIEIYGLQDELTPEVEDKDVTVRKADLQREIKSLISYAVGCMFGRYSVNAEGLQFAGGDWTTWYDANRQMLTANGYTIDPDNIIPICDDDYFDDDIVGLFVDFVRKTYGEDTLEANLQFIADALGGKGTSREVIRKYFLNEFYKDHCKIYQKRPIYWFFSSGKKNGFKALIYLHRYQPDQLARMRTDYVHEQQERYRTQLQMSEESLSSAAPSEKVKLNKRIAKLKDQALELQKYEEKIHHLADQMIPLDLDDGVKVNYAKFGDVLEKIK